MTSESSLVAMDMTQTPQDELKERTDRELRKLSREEKLKYGTLAVLGLPLLTLMHVVLVKWIIDIFTAETAGGVLGIVFFVVLLGIATIGTDFWILRWLHEEWDVFRWIRESEDAD